MAEVGAVGVEGAESGEGVEADLLPGGIVHVGDGWAGGAVFGAGGAGLADDELESVLGVDGDGLMSWGVTGRVE